MHRIDDPSAAAALPTPKQAGTPGFFTSGSPSTGVEATIVTDDWANAVQEELAYVIEQSGLTLSKADRTQLYQALGRLTRRRLTAATTFYVSPTGNDNNDGLTTGTAWASISRAYGYVRDRLDTNGYQVTIQLANGTHAAAGCSFPIVGPAPIIVGNLADPSTVIVNNATGPAFTVNAGALVVAQGFTVTAGGPAGDYGAVGSGLLAGSGGFIQFANMRFGACSYAHIHSAIGGTISPGKVGQTYTIAGASPRHMMAEGGFISIADATISIGGTPAFSTGFAVATMGGTIHGWADTFTGGATGPRFRVDVHGRIYTQAGGANYFPGNAAGVTDAATFGVYL